MRNKFLIRYQWSIPLHHGPEALKRLTAWLSHDLETARIPVSPAGVYVHAPIEVRVSNTSPTDPTTSSFSTSRPFLDQSIVPSANHPSATDESAPSTGTLYLNATLYRPFLRNPPHWRRYYEAFEYLMREYGGKPHWAKNWVTVDRDELWAMYGEGMEKWVAVRKKVDPEGVFINDWHREKLLGIGREMEEKVKDVKVEVEDVE